MSNKLIRAREFAILAHGDQLYGDKPYVHHLDAVAKILNPYGETAQIIAYLHDVLEDTKIRESEIQTLFGNLVADCVILVTDVPGSSRRIRKDLTNHKLSRITEPFTLALIVKAADRLANVREGGTEQMYRKEHAAFKKAVYRPGLCDDIWEELDRLLGE